jgi:beta-lactam-binding protein with PASTA domain
MSNDEYQKHRHVQRSSGVLPSILTSLLTSIVVTLAILAATGNISSSKLERLGWSPEQFSQVPTILGLPIESAKEILTDQNLRMVITEEDTSQTAKKGDIIQQTPLPNSELKGGEAVYVVISSGIQQVIIPEVVGKPLAEAIELLEAEGLEISELSKTGEGTPGTVTKITPNEGTEAGSGTGISVVVAPSGLPVPDLVGMDKSKAISTLEELGLKLGKLRWSYVEHKRANRVLDQAPPAGTLVTPESEVILTVNKE